MQEVIKELTCSFTGHRPESFSFGRDERSPECIRIKARLAEEIKKMAENGVDTFITGMARGVDMWAAEAVLELKRKLPHLRLIGVIPFHGQHSSWGFFERVRYGYILSRTADNVVLNEEYYRGCFHERNRYMVDNSSHLIAVYNGSDKGGTAYTVNYAKKRGLDVVIIDV